MHRQVLCLRSMLQQKYFAALFGQERHSDCDVRWYLAGQGPPAVPADPRWLRRAVPAHSVKTVPCSERLEAALDHSWYPGQNSGPRGSSAAAPVTRILKRKAPDVVAGGEDGGPARPLLALPLDGGQERGPAMAVLRFMYTQSLDHGLGVLELLTAWSVAQQLLFAPSAAACMSALEGLSRVSFEDVLQICQRNSPLLDSSDGKSFVSTCGAALASRLGDLLRIMRRWGAAYCRGRVSGGHVSWVK